MKIASNFLLRTSMCLVHFVAAIRAENDFPRRLEAAAAGSAGSDRLRPQFRWWETGQPDLEGRNIYQDNRWKDRGTRDQVIIPYEIVTEDFDAGQIQRIERDLKELSFEVKVIELVKRTNQAAYIRVTDSSGSCNSFVGKRPTGKSQDLNLASWCFNNQGTIKHEFMHAVSKKQRVAILYCKVSNWFSFSTHPHFCGFCDA